MKGNVPNAEIVRYKLLYSQNQIHFKRFVKDKQWLSGPGQKRPVWNWRSEAKHIPGEQAQTIAPYFEYQSSMGD